MSAGDYCPTCANLLHVRPDPKGSGQMMFFCPTCPYINLIPSRYVKCTGTKDRTGYVLEKQEVGTMCVKKNCVHGAEGTQCVYGPKYGSVWVKKKDPPAGSKEGSEAAGASGKGKGVAEDEYEDDEESSDESNQE